MKQFAVLCLTGLALLGCSDNDTPDQPQPATTESSNPLTGIWQGDQQVLVLEDNGDFYLPMDDQRQGLSWEQQDTTLTFRFLDIAQLTVAQQQVHADQQGDRLTLSLNDSEGNAPFTGDYRRDSQAVGFLSGTVTRPPDSDLPDNAVLTVSLLSATDTLARRVIRLADDNPAQPFRLYYPADAVSGDQDYQISSQILADGGLFYQSEITPLTMRRGRFANITLPLSAVMTPSQTLRGALAYQGNQVVFTLCNTDRRLQVAGPQQADLLTSYRDATAYPRQPRVATVSGLIRKIPGEQAGSTQAAVIVESFTLEDDSNNCRLPAAALTNTRWQLVQLGDEPVEPGSDQRPPHLLLTDQGEARGNGGCNTFNGSYDRDNNQLTLGPLTSTEMACPALETEQHYLEALETGTRYRIDGELLTLFDDDDKPVASFQAVYL
ncbi:MAG: META domain-containing protein [Pseudomonadales bacterium]|nr:META domain-containing protein [Pseudomonadales bacterium]